MILLHNPHWNTLTLLYFNADGVLVQEVERENGWFYTSHPTPMRLHVIRHLFKNHIIHDDGEE